MTTPPPPGTSYPLVLVRRAEPYRLSLESTARLSGLPPELVRRFVALGLVDAGRDDRGRLWFRAGAPRPSPGRSGCGPGCPSTTRRSGWYRTCSTASTCWSEHCAAVSELPRSEPDGHEPPD